MIYIMRKSLKNNVQVNNKININKPINKTWLALRYWFFEGLGSESVLFELETQRLIHEQHEQLANRRNIKRGLEMILGGTKC